MERIQQKGNGAVIHAQVYLDGGCTIEAGEYSIRFTGFSCPVEIEDFDLVRKCIADRIEDFGLKPETYANVTLREDGEREDVFWNKYYLVEKFSLHEYAE